VNFNLSERTVFLSLYGSHAYGFATPESDYDYRGIAIAPLDTYITGPRFEQIVKPDTYKHFPVGLFEQDPRVDGNDPTKSPDIQVMDIVKFVKLALQNNPSVIEILFTDEKQIIVCNPIMKRLLDVRHKFLSRACKERFCNYAVSQLKKAIRHRKWILDPPKNKPTREEFGLFEYDDYLRDQIGAAEALINREVDGFMIDQTELSEDLKIEISSGLYRMMRAIWFEINSEKDYPIGYQNKYDSTRDVLYWAAVNNRKLDSNFIEVLNREKKYQNSKREWDSYQHWVKERNPKRAEIEKKFGLDAKNACHLIRLIRECREILETGDLKVFRPDAKELLEIRNGAWSYEKIIEYAETEEQELNEVAKKSSLPKIPPINEINSLVFDMILEFNGK
jgi:hypothetical protein